MLVYEYISNGTLPEQIHSSSIQEHRIPWDLKLKIGAESAKALSYLHSEASPPILHGDIKSSNILLSENFTAKVSDFGTSTFAPKDKSRFMTMIQGTYGYLDPEYLQTGDLTDKSDVYSFGVVMINPLSIWNRSCSLSYGFNLAFNNSKPNDPRPFQGIVEIVGKVSDVTWQLTSTVGKVEITLVDVSPHVTTSTKQSTAHVLALVVARLPSSHQET